jgi:hypothetical protein
MLGHVSALVVGHLQGACKFFLACAAFASTYMVGILHMIKIQVIVIRLIIRICQISLLLKYNTVYNYCN